MLLGRMNLLPLGRLPGDFFLSREEYDGIFSVGDVGGGECGAFDFAVFREPVAEMRDYFWFGS